ncbi:MAG: acyltransferase [Polyangiaceae bacterium]
MTRTRDPLHDHCRPHSHAGFESVPPGSEKRTFRAFGAKVMRALADELAFDSRQVAARVVSRALPQFAFNRTRTFALRQAGVRIGKGSGFLGPLDVTGPGDMRELFSVGDETFISGPLHIDLGAEVRIGSRVQLGHHVLLLTVDHEMGPSTARCGALTAAPIIIGDGVWIASRVTVLPGVVIGDGAIVAAGAVVSRDVAPNTMVAGMPAKLVRDLDDAVPLRRHRPRSQPPPPRDGRFT